MTLSQRYKMEQRQRGITLRIPKALRDSLDAKRGDLSQQQYILNLLSKTLETSPNDNKDRTIR